MKLTLTVKLFLVISLIAGMAVPLAGCHLRPNFGPPGTIGMQRDRAVLHDPFPNNDLGPAVVGGRPRGYELPLPEATDTQGSPFAHLSLGKTLLNLRPGRAQPRGF